MSHSLQHTVLPHNSATGLPASNSSENVLFLLNIDNNWLCSENVYYNCIEYIFWTITQNPNEVYPYIY